jgi:hypothetical protein
MSNTYQEVKDKLNSTKGFETYRTDIWTLFGVKYKGKEIGFITYYSGWIESFTLIKDDQRIGTFKWQGVENYIKFVKEVMAKKYAKGGLLVDFSYSIGGL